MLLITEARLIGGFSLSNTANRHGRSTSSLPKSLGDHSTIPTPFTCVLTATLALHTFTQASPYPPNPQQGFYTMASGSGPPPGMRPGARDPFMPEGDWGNIFHNPNEEWSTENLRGPLAVQDPATDLIAGQGRSASQPPPREQQHFIIERYCILCRDTIPVNSEAEDGSRGTIHCELFLPKVCFLYVQVGVYTLITSEKKSLRCFNSRRASSV